MTTRLFVGGTVYAPGAAIQDGAVLVDGTRITAVGTARDLLPLARSTDGVEVVDASGLSIVPGFIDLQVNGAAGRLPTEEPTPDAALSMARVLPRYGCTAFLPTVISAPLGQMAAAASAIAAAVAAEGLGARVLGSHLEGPFINPRRAGVHRVECLRSPSAEDLATLLGAGRGTVRLLTLAPELPGADELIRTARRGHVTVAMGHTEASPREVDAAAAAGVRLVTHLFNGMAPLGSREPGTVGAALSNDALCTSLIADGVHVHPASLTVAVRTKGPERTVLVTDAMPPVGTEAPGFSLYGTSVVVRNGACYMPDGRLAGSVLTMNAAVRNAQQLAGVSASEAVAMASTNPARMIGLDGRKGSLAPGYDADIVVCDAAFNVALTIVEGRVVHKTPWWSERQA